MNRITARTSLFVICVFGVGCTGLKFADTPLNKALPQDYKNRVLWNETDVFKYNLEQLVGHIIYEEGTNGGYARGPRIVDRSKPPVMKAIEGGTIYESKIDRGAAAEGSYLAFAAKMDAKQSAEVQIIDNSQVFIPYENIPIGDLLKAGASTNGARKRFYIQGVLLAGVLTKYSSEITADASGVVGNTFGAKGNVYNERGEIARDVRISLLLLDLDKLSLLSSASNLKAAEVNRTLRAATAKGIKIESLKGIEDLQTEEMR